MDSSENRNLRLFNQLKAELQVTRHQLKMREQLWESELNLAARVHQSLLPVSIRQPRIEVEVRYVPMKAVGGDYCQVLFPVDSQCYVTLCDVTGHGIGSALLATRVSSYVRQLVMQQLCPMQIVSNLNSFVFENFSDLGLQFLSFFVAQIDLESLVVTYSGAGHPSPLMLRLENDSIDMLESQNMLIGVQNRCLHEHPQDVKEIAPGERLFFYTDGLTESEGANGTMLGHDGLLRILTETTSATVFELADHVQQRITEFRHGPALDDMTFIVVELGDFGERVSTE